MEPTLFQLAKTKQTLKDEIYESMLIDFINGLKNVASINKDQLMQNIRNNIKDEVKFGEVTRLLDDKLKHYLIFNSKMLTYCSSNSAVFICGFV